MGGSSKSQVVGYQYFAKFALFIGNRIEKLVAINFDNRGWMYKPDDDQDVMVVRAGNIYGENEGGVSGYIDIHKGTPGQQPNPDFQQTYPLVSGFPYQSYLYFRSLGNTPGPISISPAGFYLGNSGYMREMLLWVKRIHVKNDGSEQWYDEKSEIGENMPYSDILGSYVKNGNIFDVVSVNKIPKDIDITAKTDCIGGIHGDFSYSLKTVGADIDDGVVVSDEIKMRYGIYDLFKNLELKSSGYSGSSDGGIFLDHADAWYPNWEVNKDKIMDNKVFVSSVGFSAMYLIELKSRTKHTDFSIKFNSNKSFILSNIYVDNFNDGYVQGRYLAIILDAYDQATIKFKTENVPDSGTGLAVRSYVRSSIVIKEMKYTGSVFGSDINPIHKIREILTDDTAMNKPEIDINNINFAKAADRIFNEGLGISWAITEKSCLEAIEELCYHIEAGVRVNRQTGLYEVVLFRDDWFPESEIRVLPQSKIKSISFDIQNADEIINHLNVSYYDRQSIKNLAFSIYENGSIMTVGNTNSEDVNFPYFMNSRNAEVVAQWKLKQFSTPCFSGSFSTGFYDARKWNRYDIVKITWAQKGIIDMPVRIMKINLGDGVNNTVTIDFVEVVPYSGMVNSTIIVPQPDDTPEAPKANIFKAFEMPYLELVQAFGQNDVDIELARNPGKGYVGAVAIQPQSNSLNSQMQTDAGAGYNRASTINYSQIAYLDGSIDQVKSAFAIKNFGNIDYVRAGSIIFVNDEIMVYESFNDVTKLLTVKRGALDTVPQMHDHDSKLFFSDDFVSYDNTEYSESEIINVKSLTTTPSGILDIGLADSQSVEIKSRAIRPYPPANIKINGEYYPAEIETDLVITWVDRNRIQQTGGEVLGWFDTGVNIEQNTATKIIIIEEDENHGVIATHNNDVTETTSYTLPIASLNTNTRYLNITAKTVKDGFDSYQKFNHTIDLSQFFTAPYNLKVEFKDD